MLRSRSHAAMSDEFLDDVLLLILSDRTGLRGVLYGSAVIADDFCYGSFRLGLTISGWGGLRRTRPGRYPRDAANAHIRGYAV